MQLSELQREFIAAIRSASNPSCGSSLLTKQNQERLNIYRNSSLGALKKALINIFPICNKLVGEDFFLAMAQDYISQHPSQTSNLIYYGEYFPTFIKGYIPAASVPYLADVAQLELLWHSVFYGPNNATLDFAQLTQAIQSDGERIIFLLPFGSKLLTSLYPVHKIWDVCQAEYSGEISIDFTTGPSYLLIWQMQYKIKIESLSKAEFLLLQLIARELPLQQVCDEFAELEVDVTADQLFPALCQRGCLYIKEKICLP